MIREKVWPRSLSVLDDKILLCIFSITKAIPVFLCKLSLQYELDYILFLLKRPQNEKRQEDQAFR